MKHWIFAKFRPNRLFLSPLLAKIAQFYSLNLSPSFFLCFFSNLDFFAFFFVLLFFCFRGAACSRTHCVITRRRHGVEMIHSEGISKGEIETKLKLFRQNCQFSTDIWFFADFLNHSNSFRKVLRKMGQMNSIFIIRLTDYPIYF